MLDIQLGRRNLSPIQRIAVAEKYRPLYEKEAKENQSKAGNNYGIGKEKPLPNLVNPISPIDTTKKLAEVANVGKETYRMGAKILNSDDEDLKQRVQSGKTSISARLFNDRNTSIICLVQSDVSNESIHIASIQS